MLSDVKCPECGLKKFEKEPREIKLKGKEDSDDMLVTALTCIVCGNVMLNTNPKDKFVRTLVPKKFKLTE